MNVKLNSFQTEPDTIVGQLRGHLKTLEDKIYFLIQQDQDSIIAYLAILQATIPPEIQGRVLTLQASVNTAMTPFGLAVAGPVADALGPQIWYLIAGLAAMTAGIGGCFIPALMRIEDKAKTRDEAFASA
jgi:hypothetical protein